MASQSESHKEIIPPPSEAGAEGAPETAESGGQAADRMKEEAARSFQVIEGGARQVEEKIGEGEVEGIPVDDLMIEKEEIVQTAATETREHDEAVDRIGRDIEEALGGEVPEAPEIKPEEFVDEEAEKRRAEQDREKRKEIAEKEKKQLERKQQMEEAGREWARLQTQQKKYSGLTGKLRLMRDNVNIYDLKVKILEAKERYQELRAEYVGENVERMLLEQERQLEDLRTFMEQEKPALAKVLNAAYRGYKKLGEMNLGKVFDAVGYQPKSKIMRFVARAASVRTLISVGLVAGGAVFASPTVAIGALAMRRALGGVGGAVGSYDIMKMVADKTAGRFTEEELDKMSREDVMQRMEKISAQAMMDGKSFGEIESYQKLKARLGEMLKEERETGPGAGVERKLAQLMSETDERFETMRQKTEKNDKIMKGAAAAIGVFVGSGALAKGITSLYGYVGGGGEAAVGVQAAALEKVPPVDQAPAPMAGTLETEQLVDVDEAGDLKLVEAEIAQTPADSFAADYKAGLIERGFEGDASAKAEQVLEAARVSKREGLTHVIRRQVVADPERFGWDTAKRPWDPEHLTPRQERWATNLCAKIARDNGMLSRTSEWRLTGFDPADQEQYVFVKDDGAGGFRVELEGIEHKVFHRPTEFNFSEGGAKWGADLQYSRNGLLRSVRIEGPPPKFKMDALVGHFAESKQLQVDADTLLARPDAAAFEHQLSKIYQQEEILERLQRRGLGNSLGARELRDSIRQDYGVINNWATKGADLVRSEKLTDYVTKFREAGVGRDQLEKYAFSVQHDDVHVLGGAGGQVAVDSGSEQAREAARAIIDSTKQDIFNKTRMLFDYDPATGRVVDVHSRFLKLDVAAERIGVRKDFLTILQDQGLNPEQRQEAARLIRDIANEQTGLTKFEQGGLSHLPEYRFLAGDIAEKVRRLRELAGSDSDMWAKVDLDTATQETARLTRGLSLKIEAPKILPIEGPVDISQDAAAAIQEGRPFNIADGVTAHYTEKGLMLHWKGVDPQIAEKAIFRDNWEELLIDPSDEEAKRMMSLMARQVYYLDQAADKFYEAGVQEEIRTSIAKQIACIKLEALARHTTGSHELAEAIFRKD
ncbi:hypothetical protein AMJ57_00100 [Parcubacteria bacterium SG8_24]|nr:MAG: hypothetical protein AMJ57_00100 [Parcubacteria bacterium SG8_24]